MEPVTIIVCILALLTVLLFGWLKHVSGLAGVAYQDRTSKLDVKLLTDRIDTLEKRFKYLDQQKEQKVIDLLQEAKELGFQLSHTSYEQFNSGSARMTLSFSSIESGFNYIVTSGGYLKATKPKRKKKEVPAPPALKSFGNYYGTMTFDQARTALDQEKAKLFTECRAKGECK